MTTKVELSIKFDRGNVGHRPEKCQPLWKGVKPNKALLLGFVIQPNLLDSKSLILKILEII